MREVSAADVADLQVGDKVTATFMELSKPEFRTRWERNRDGVQMGVTERVGGSEPTGNYYVLSGELSHYESVIFPEDTSSLQMSNGQCVRQASGQPGGWLVSITKWAVVS